jgi:hypothetical protein
MTDPILTLVCDRGNAGGPSSEPIASMRQPLAVPKAVLYAIGRWCLAPPKLRAYAPAQECANARAARIRRAQDAVDELFARPSPEEACFARFWGFGG